MATSSPEGAITAGMLAEDRGNCREDGNKEPGVPSLGLGWVGGRPAGCRLRILRRARTAFGVFTCQQHCLRLRELGLGEIAPVPQGGQFLKFGGDAHGSRTGESECPSVNKVAVESPSSMLFTIDRGGHSGVAAEGVGEVAVIVEAAGLGDVGDGAIGGLEQAAGVAEADLQQVVFWRDSEDALEASCELAV